MDTYSWRPNNHSCPPCKCHILVIFKAPANCSIAYSFLTFFKFFQQTKITRNFYSWKQSGKYFELRKPAKKKKARVISLIILVTLQKTFWVKTQKYYYPLNENISTLGKRSSCLAWLLQTKSRCLQVNVLECYQAGK